MAEPTWDETEPADEEEGEQPAAEAPPSFESTIEAGEEAAKGPGKPFPIVATGPEAAAKAMEDELDSRNWFEKLTGGLGTALSLPVARMKQMGLVAGPVGLMGLPARPGTGPLRTGLSAKDQADVEAQRQIATTGPGIAGNLLGNVAMGGAAAGPVLAGGRMAALPVLARGAARVAAPVAAGAGVTAATQPTLPGESELTQAAIGGAAGGVGRGAAASLPVLVRGAGALLRTGASSTAKASREAVERLVKAMEQDGLDPATVLKQADELARSTGKPITLGDVIGDKLEANNTRALLQESLQTAEGPERAALIRGIEARSQGQQDRIVKDLAKTIGASEVPRSEAFEELARVKSAAAKPLYDKAFASDRPIVDEHLLDLWKRPSMLDGLRAVIKDAAERGEEIPKIAWGGDPAKVPKALLTGEEFKEGVPMIYAPTIKMLDLVKRKLWDIEQDAYKLSPTTGKPAPTQSSGTIAETRRALTKILDEDVAPAEYKQARKIWGDYSEMEQAFKQGNSLFKHDPAVIAKVVKEATPAEREAFASGIFAHINEGMTSKEQLDWAGNALLRDRRRMAQLRAAFGEGEKAQAAFDQFERALEAESAAMRSMRTYPPSGKSMHVAGMNKAEIASTAAQVAGGGGALATLMAMLRRASGVSMSKPAALELAKTGFTPLETAGGRTFAQLRKHKPKAPSPLEIGTESLATGPLEFLRDRRKPQPQAEEP